MGFYEDMAGVSAELLAPTSQGGLGQGSIVLVKLIPGATDPDQPWLPPAEPTPQRTPLNGAATGVSKELIGTEASPGTAIVSSDLQVICAPWNGTASPEDTLEIDGNPVTIMAVSNIPPVGVVAAVRMIVRG